MPSRKYLSLWVLGLYLFLYGTLQAAFSLKTGFRPAENDFLGNINIAHGINWGLIESLHNGFFAAGFPVMLALMPSNHVFLMAGAVSLCFGLVSLLATFTIASRLGGRWCGVAAVALLSCNPLFFDYVASPGPDLIAIGLTTAGLAVYVNEGMLQVRPRPVVLLVSGLLFGIAGLFRAHALVLAGGLLIWAALQGNSRLRSVLFAGMGVAIGILPQIIINLLGGFGPLEADTGFYIYESSLGMDWYTTGSIPRELYASPLSVIGQHPTAFLAAYLMAFTNYVIPILTLAVATLLAPNRQARRALSSILVSTLAFALIVSAAASPRGPLPILPQAAIGLAVVLFWLSNASSSSAVRWQRVAVISLILGVVIWPELREIALSASAKNQAAVDRAATEDAVIAGGRVQSASQVLTDDFFLYFTDIPGNVPDRIGGWENISLNGRRPHTDVSLASVQDFYCSARKRGIDTVLWHPTPVVGIDPVLSAALDGGSQSPLLVNAGTIGPYTVTELPVNESVCLP